MVADETREAVTRYLRKRAAVGRLAAALRAIGERRGAMERESAETPRPPAWIDEYARSYGAGETHTFILHGDVEGVAYQGLSQRRLLFTTLGARRAVVVRYSLADGIAVEDEDEAIDWEGTRLTRGELARRLVAGERAATPTPTGATAAALAALNGDDEGDDPLAASTPTAAFAVLGRLLRAGPRVAVVIDHADLVAPSPAVPGKGAMSPDDRLILAALLSWPKDRTITRYGNPVFLISRELDELHPDLRAADVGWRAIQLRLPDREARLAYLTWYLRLRADEDAPIPLDGIDAPELANLTAGLSLRNIEDVLLLGAREGGVDRGLVKGYKDRVIATTYGEVAEMIEPLPGGFGALGGMEPLKEWAREHLIAPVRAGETGDVPKGVLLVGPPGTGKTYFVRALAREVGFSAMALNASKILGKYVGESEGKLARTFAFARSLAPVLIFMDELDQSDMSKRGNDSGNPVASNLFSAMLQFLSDETLRGKVVLVFATNRPDLLDPALLRFGRMDAIIPVLLPEAAERRSIAIAQARAQGFVLTGLSADALASATDKYSAADIGAVVRKAGQLARRAGADCVYPEYAERALALIRPQSAQQADYFTRLAVAACNDAELLPEKYAVLLEDRAALEAGNARAATPFEEGVRRGRRDY